MEPQESFIMSTIEKGSLVLITGVTGFIASHVALQFLEAGYRVRGTVRSEAKAKWLYDLFDHKYGKGKFETTLVPDMMAEGAFDQAVIGCSGIVHLASIMTFSDKPEEVIPPTVKGALNILTSATKEPGIKSVVYTSSSTAALLPKPNEVIKITKDTWNEETVKLASGPEPSAFAVSTWSPSIVRSNSNGCYSGLRSIEDRGGKGTLASRQRDSSSIPSGSSLTQCQLRTYLKTRR